MYSKVGAPGDLDFCESLLCNMGSTVEKWWLCSQGRKKKHTFDNKIDQTVQRSRLRPLRRVRDCCFYLQFNQDHGRPDVLETLTRDTHIVELESGQLWKCFGLHGRHVVRELVGRLRGYRKRFKDLYCFCEFPFL